MLSCMSNPCSLVPVLRHRGTFLETPDDQTFVCPFWVKRHLASDSHAFFSKVACVNHHFAPSCHDGVVLSS